MSLNDLIVFTQANHAQGIWMWFFILVTVAGALGLFIGLFWGVCKSGRGAVYTTATMLLVNALFVYHKYDDHDSRILIACLLIGAAALYITAAFWLKGPEHTAPP